MGQRRSDSWPARVRQGAISDGGLGEAPGREISRPESLRDSRRYSAAVIASKFVFEEVPELSWSCAAIWADSWPGGGFGWRSGLGGLLHLAGLFSVIRTPMMDCAVCIGRCGRGVFVGVYSS